ncbi:PREDICTED: protein still life, isoforms C/SIF type 2-like [Rhagoletis zephyria]|uniref:protein still life, isoforms C/SIF type 2-like n=1 Tax=Rhagoletis zephyria TaxID=28612 RepID=UPI000811433F|nr:PREDICTED: protein still life, isoforms C/SIF type 2-like [Rhagoletis zephyria]
MPPTIGGGGAYFASFSASRFYYFAAFAHTRQHPVLCLSSCASKCLSFGRSPCATICSPDFVNCLHAKSSAPLGFYTPVKAPIDNLFQLGVTRAPNGNGHHAYNKTSTPTTNGTTATQNGQSNGGGGGGGVNSNGSNNGGGNSEGGADEGEETAESLQYIKPANDDLTIAYSEGTQKTDLLY